MGGGGRGEEHHSGRDIDAVEQGGRADPLAAAPEGVRSHKKEWQLDKHFQPQQTHKPGRRVLDLQKRGAGACRVILGSGRVACSCSNIRQLKGLLFSLAALAAPLGRIALNNRLLNRSQFT